MNYLCLLKFRSKQKTYVKCNRCRFPFQKSALDVHLILSTFRIKSSGHEKEFTTELKPKIYTINVDIEVPGLYD